MTIVSFVQWVGWAKYIAFFCIALAEGPVAMTISGFLLRLGYVSFWPVYIALMLGDLTGDVLWYFGGYYYGKRIIARFGRFFGIEERVVYRIERAFERHSIKILLISKLTMSFGFAIPVLLAAGMARVPFKRFVLLNGMGQIIFTAALLAVGYFFGKFYLTLNQGFRYLSIGAFVIFVVLALNGIRQYMKKKKVYEKL